MQKQKGKWITHREAAQVRLAQWAAVLLRVMYRGAPNPKMYHKQPFKDERVDHDRLARYINQDERFEDALDTDHWLQDLRDSRPEAYEAVMVRYLKREPGGRRLSGKDQVREFKKRTGLGTTAYYSRLKEAERYVGLMSGVAGAFSG